jgi:SAM-dependent methyltransferase
MESFSADWLALRELADHAARSADVTARVAARLEGSGRTRAIDLACGTGSNMRYLLPRLPHLAHWTLVDHDPALLSVAEQTLEPLAREYGVAIETRRLDLASLDTLPLDDCALVTASALLDLVSADWIRAFADRCRTASAVVLCALSYDGRMLAEPPEPGDVRVRELVNAHQRTDKGFGPALGPDAVAAAEAAFSGCSIVTSASDWLLGPDSDRLQRALVQGWAGAAREMAGSETEALDAWEARRLAHIDGGRSRLVVGHVDLAAWPLT